MIDEKTKNRIKELRESLTVKETAKTLEISESTVKRHSSNNYEKENELDEKISNEMTKIMLLEGYDFEDEIKTLIYALKDQVNEMDITLWNHINDIKDNTNTFLRITDKPIRFYYIFMLFASNLNLITEHITSESLIEAVDNFINREVKMEKTDEYIATCDTVLEEMGEEWEEWKEKILNAKEEYNDLVVEINITKEVIKELSSRETYWTKKLLENPSGEEQLQKTLKMNSELKTFAQKLIEGAEIQKKEIQDLKSENQELKKAVEKINHDALSLIKAFEQVKEKNSLLEREIEQVNQENALLERADDQVNHLYPVEMENIIEKMENEELQRSETKISQTPL